MGTTSLSEPPPPSTEPETQTNPEIEWEPAYFNPPLSGERNGWVLNQIRKHSAQKILDIGCGEGSLLRSLCEPSRDKYDPRTALNPDVSYRQIYATSIGGFDVEKHSVDGAVERLCLTSYDPTAPRYASGGFPRWDDLHVKLWQGGIETLNEDFVDAYECFVSMEVVEHVPEEILDLFLPIVLGYYRPALLLLTTPNYAYNELFQPPGEVNPTGFPDPTGKTDRVFRHHDHKREWLISEWKEWCEDGAKRFGYDVELDGVGTLGRPDPYGREVEGYGTLTAAFKRTEDRPRVKPPTMASPSAEHKLVAEYHYPAHPQSGSPLPTSELLELLKNVFSQSDSNELPIEDLWSEGLDVACGGLPSALVHAVISAPAPPLATDSTSPPDLEWGITQGAPHDLFTWLILWKNWVPPPRPPPPAENGSDIGQGMWNGEIDEDEYYWPASKSGEEAAPGWGQDQGEEADVSASSLIEMSNWGTSGDSDLGQDRARSAAQDLWGSGWG